MELMKVTKAALCQAYHTNTSYLLKLNVQAIFKAYTIYIKYYYYTEKMNLSLTLSKCECVLLIKQWSHCL